MKFFDTNHPMFRPLWIRFLICAVSGGWAMFEFSNGAHVWGILFLAFFALSFWGFFVDFRPRDPE
ncbi:DUF3329 domain-containing protein [Aliihoeflea sp. PC F10.4]